MNTRPVTDQCLMNFEKRTHVCFGISPFNSYFSEQRIQELAAWGKREFTSMHFFVPDVPSAYTLEALGYSSEKAAWKARRQSQYLQNKIHRALKNLSYSDFDSWEMVLNWEKLSANEHYLGLYKQVTELFEQDPYFRAACVEASHWVLEKRVENASLLTPDVLHSAARYLLTEIPLFVDTAGIVEKESSVFSYHQCISFIEGLFKGLFPIRSTNQQGFVVIEPILQNRFIDQESLQMSQLS